MSKCHCQIEIDASPAEVWEIVGDPYDMLWNPLVQSCRAEDGGDKRRLTMDVSGFDSVPGQTLDVLARVYDLDEDNRSYRYSFVGDTLPITNHEVFMHVGDNGAGGTLWTEQCDWDLTEDLSPEEEQSLIDMVEATWMTGMRSVKQRLEDGRSR